MNSKLLRVVKRYCPLCDKEHEVEERERLSSINIKGECVKYKEGYFECKETNEEENEFVSAKMMDENLLRARDVYRKEHNMLTSLEIKQIRQKYGVTQAEFSYMLGLGEVMDDPAVIHAEESMFVKMNLFENRTIDGHAPYLPNKELSAYKMAGVDTDHEATTFEYALEEVRRGLHVHIREGSAAHNLKDIVEGIVRTGIDTEYFSFCTDDKHIEDILRDGHIDYSVKMAVKLGLDPIRAIKMATINTAKCYGLKHLGAISPGFQADFVVLDNLTDLNVTDVFYKGKRLNEDAPIRVRPCSHVLKHTVHLDKVKAERFLLPISKKKTHVIEIHAGQITTTDLTISLPPTLNFEPFGAYSKIAAVERHHNTGKIGVAVAKGYGIRNGAVASSVSHDSHNIIVIGDNDADMAIAVNEIIRTQGGYTVVENGKVYETLALPIMGLMSDAGFENVNEALQRMIQKAHQMGVASKIDPFVTLSFLALPVIPELRITPRGICKMTAKGPAILS